MNQSKRIPRGEFIAFCKKAYKDYGLSASTTDTYISYMKNVAQYMEDMGVEFYDIEFGSSYLEKAKGVDHTVSHKKSKCYSAALSLVDSAIQGLPYTLQRRLKKTVDFPECAIGKYAKDFIENVKDRHLRDSTFQIYLRMVSDFSHSMAIKGHTLPSQISRKDILDYVQHKPATNHWSYTIVKSFLSFLQERGAIDSVVAHVLDGRRKMTKKALPSYYTSEEVARIESAFERETKLGKRNYAMALLASRLGIRASDICLLQLENLDWKENVIKFIQRKTGRELELPLLSEVGDAIIDYLRHARPATKNRTLFISMLEPYRGLHVSTMSDAIAKAIKRAGIATVGRHTGAHSLRHSLATAMMQSNTSIQVISSALGHSDSISTMGYIHVAIDSLMECTHEVPPVGKDYYEQKGGAFYV